MPARALAGGIIGLVDLYESIKDKWHWRGHDMVYSGRHSHRNYDAFMESHDIKGLLENSEGEITVSTQNPLGSKEIENDDVHSQLAARLFDATEDRLRIPSIAVNIGLNGDSLNYEVKQGLRSKYSTYEGTLETDIAREDVEPYLSQFGFNRHDDNWRFDNIEGRLDEFIGLEEEQYDFW